jgi:hypothetical protein
VSQKELEKALNEAHEATEPAVLPNLHRMKAGIEILADFDDLKKVREFIEQMKNPSD